MTPHLSTSNRFSQNNEAKGTEEEASARLQIFDRQRQKGQHEAR